MRRISPTWWVGINKKLNERSAMTPERWQQIAQLYEAAIEREPGARAAFVSAAAVGDDELCREVQTLLAHEDSPLLIDRSLLAVAAAVLQTAGSLEPNTQLGPYRIERLIGAGGMGEVYRARDAKLERDVAIKVLPQAVADDPDRIARLVREARTLAALNHPNIAHIHGFEEVAGIRALVMELVEGPTLADRIARGAIPLDEALPIARQIAEALEAAHEQGIVHRDLKPANIKVRDDGLVKVLDFGLAKAMEPSAASASDVTGSPTVMSPAMTQMGVILGTAAYMSPEQAKGRAADKRTDIWAFGCVLYEMLTGRRAFEGDDVTDTLAAVLRSEPNWTVLPADLPSSMQVLLRSCLEKDRKERVADMSTVRFIMRTPAIDRGPLDRGPQHAWSGRTAGFVAAIVLLIVSVTSALIGWTIHAPASRQQVMRFAVALKPGLRLASNDSVRQVALSPDGTHLVYASEEGGTAGLVVHSLDQSGAGWFSGVRQGFAPFISQDSQWIGFFSTLRGELDKMSMAGGSPITLCRTNGAPRGASWGPDDIIVFATDDPATGLLSVSAAGGEAQVLTRPDQAQGEVDHVYPSVLPDGRAVLFTVTTTGPRNSANIAVLERATGHMKILLRGATYAEYVSDGYLVYVANGALWAVRFDPRGLEMTGAPIKISEPVGISATGTAQLSVSSTGVLAYVTASVDTTAAARRSLVWVDRQGRQRPLNTPLRAYRYARLSPDGTRAALDIRDQENDIWIWDFSSEALTRFTSDPRDEVQPLWTPDGTRILFGSNRAGATNVFSQRVDGTGSIQRLTTSPNAQIPQAITPDGKTAALLDQSDGGNAITLLHLGEQPTTQPLGIRGTDADISPDGKWIAYNSNESGKFQVVVRPFPNVNGGRWQVTTDGGNRPRWAHSGTELFYVTDEPDVGAVMSVPVQTTLSFSAGKPRKLFDWPTIRETGLARTYDVSRDGKEFLMIKDASRADRATTSPSENIVVVLNWTEELKQRVPAR
jgi:serine/threonine-protein kinase